MLCVRHNEFERSHMIQQGSDSALWILAHCGIFEDATQIHSHAAPNQRLQGQRQWTCSTDKSAENLSAQWVLYRSIKGSFCSPQSHFLSPPPRGAHYTWGLWRKIGMLLSSDQAHSSPMLKNTNSWLKSWTCSLECVYVASGDFCLIGACTPVYSLDMLDALSYPWHTWM